MASTAPECEYPGCSRNTWTGRCWQHIDVKDSSGEAAIKSLSHMSSPGLSVPKPSSDTSLIQSHAKSVFPDLPNDMKPSDLRAEAMSTLYAAVGIEVYRDEWFPAANVEDQSKRDSTLKGQMAKMISEYQITPVTINQEQAAMVASSSIDKWGRGLDDSRSLSSYAIKTEWELARSMDIAEDENGLPYGNSYEGYVKRINEGGQFEVAAQDEFVRRMVQYDQIIEESTGSKPKCKEPVLPNVEPTYSENEDGVGTWTLKVPSTGTEIQMSDAEVNEVQHAQEDSGSKSLMDRIPVTPNGQLDRVAVAKAAFAVSKVATTAAVDYGKERHAKRKASPKQQDRESKRKQGAVDFEERRRQRAINAQIAEDNRRQKKADYLLDTQYEEARKRNRKFW